MISALSSQKYLVVVEVPFYFNMSALMGLARYDSEDDDEDGSHRKFHFMDWRPEVRRLSWFSARTRDRVFSTCTYRFDIYPLQCIPPLEAAGRGFTPTPHGCTRRAFFCQLLICRSVAAFPPSSLLRRTACASTPSAARRGSCGSGRCRWPSSPTTTATRTTPKARDASLRTRAHPMIPTSD